MSKTKSPKGTENPLLNHLLDKARAMEGARAIAAGKHDGQWPRRTWVISDGTAGMLSQCLALSRAMDIDAEDIRAMPTPLLRAFPRLAEIPGWQLTLGRKPDWLKLNQWPDLLITCGRRMAGISIGVKRMSGGKTKTIHIQDPRVNPACFDLLITPAHDEIAQAQQIDGGQNGGQNGGRNILTTTGAMNRLSPEEIAEDAALLREQYGPTEEPKDGQKEGPEEGSKDKLAVVMLGGHNRRYKAGEQAFAHLAEELTQFAGLTGARLAIIPSRRTPRRGLRRMTALLEETVGGDRIWVWDGGRSGGPNPYPGVLGLADYIIVTADSVNMTSEAAITGKPVLTAEMAPKSTGETGRIARFHQMMKAGGHTAGLSDVLLNPEQLDEPFTILDERAKTAKAVYDFFGEPAPEE